MGHRRKATMLVYMKCDVTFDLSAALRLSRQMGLLEGDVAGDEQKAAAG